MFYRQILDRQVRVLQDEILILGSMVEVANLTAMDALNQRDPALARRIWAGHLLIHEKRLALETAILITIATQQPTARDLRRLTVFLEIGTELERMGDYAKRIARVVLRLGDSPIPIPIRELNEMAGLGMQMLHRSLSAFLEEDVQLASQIPVEDDLVNHLYRQVYRRVVASMVTYPDLIDPANLILWVAHNLERLADRVKNICERTIFATTGERLEFKDDELE